MDKTALKLLYFFKYANIQNGRNGLQEPCDKRGSHLCYAINYSHDEKNQSVHRKSSVKSRGPTWEEPLSMLGLELPR